MGGRRADVLSEAAKACGWLRRERSGDAQCDEGCDAGSEPGGEREATEAWSEAQADGMGCASSGVESGAFIVKARQASVGLPQKRRRERKKDQQIGRDGSTGYGATMA